MSRAVPVRYQMPDHLALTVGRAMRQRRWPPRQRQVVWLYLHGMAYKEIAATLGMAYETVRSHLRTVFAETWLNETTDNHRIQLLRLLCNLPPKVVRGQV